MDAAQQQSSQPSTSATSVNPAKNDDSLRAEVLEILSNTANGCLAELGYYPGIVPRLRDAEAKLAQLQSTNSSLWEDNRRLAQSLDVLKTRMTAMRAGKDDHVQAVLALQAENRALRGEVDAFLRLAAAEKGQKMQLLMQEFDTLTRKHQMALKDISILHNNLIALLTAQNPPSNNGVEPPPPPPPAQGQPQPHSMPQQQGQHTTSQPNVIPVAVPVRRVSQDMTQTRRSSDITHHHHPQHSAPAGRMHGGQVMPQQVFHPVPAQQPKHPGDVVYQPGTGAPHPDPRSTVYANATPHVQMPQYGPACPHYVPPQQVIGQYSPAHGQPMQYQVAHNPHLQNRAQHTVYPSNAVPHPGVMNPGIVPSQPQAPPYPHAHQPPGPPHGYYVPVPSQQTGAPDVIGRPPMHAAPRSHHSTPNSSRPSSSHSSTYPIRPLSINTQVSSGGPVYAGHPHMRQMPQRRASQNAYPITPSTPSMNLPELEAQYPPTPLSARTADSPQKVSPSALGSTRPREVVDLTSVDEPEPKRPRLEETAPAQPTPPPSSGPNGPEGPVKEESTKEESNTSASQPGEEADEDVPSFEDCVQTLFVLVEPSTPEKGKICYLCKHRYENKIDPNPPSVFTNPTLNEQVDHAKTEHPTVWEHLRLNRDSLDPE